MPDIQGLRHIRYEIDPGHVGLLTIDRPPVNALGRELVEDLHAACTALGEDDGPRALVVAAKGKAFCAGADLKERRTMSEEDVQAWVPFLSGAFTRLAALPMPTIACIQGIAAGGGLELALACDLRVAEEGVKIGLRETALAIIPGAGGTQRLPRLIGPSRAKMWIFTARLFDASEAQRDGVVDLVAGAGKGLEAALGLAAEIAGNGPLAIRAAKRAVDKGASLTLAEGLKAELRAYGSIIRTEDRVEAVRAFNEKRRPDFKGR
ncbi:MAG TPA: enoyl-CoA hydratase-related protein [Candidatus Saccharimonadales bacterium]|nr:enoyl-CoA hydratase-related protein [Candidatus Saccharimonadales bacterium]